MDNDFKVKLKFVVSLSVKHSKRGLRSLIHKLALEHFDKLTCRPDDNVLYVGCGTGDQAVILATRVHSVTGIDVASDVLEIAKRDYPADNVEYMLDDLEDASPNLSKWRESFSKVVSIARLKHFPKVQTAVRNMVGCLKPGGELLCIFSNNDCNFFDGAAKVIEDHPEWGKLVKERNVSMWRQTAEQTEEFFKNICEWSHISCEAKRTSANLTEEKAKLMWLDCLDHVDRVGQSQQEECLEAMWQWAKNEYQCAEDGCLTKPSEFMVVHGVKKN